MSSLKQNLLEYSNAVQKVKGTSNTSNLRKAFPSAPQYNDYKDIDALNLYQDFLNAEGLTLAEAGVDNFSMNYNNGAPDLNEVATGGGGLPATPFSPNVTSPGPGDHNATSQPEFDGDTKNIDSINNFGSGLGGLVSPASTVKNLGQTKLGQYISGRSYQGSDGK